MKFVWDGIANLDVNGKNEKGKIVHVVMFAASALKVATIDTNVLRKLHLRTASDCLQLAVTYSSAFKFP